MYFSGNSAIFVSLFPAGFCAQFFAPIFFPHFPWRAPPGGAKRPSPPPGGEGVSPPGGLGWFRGSRKLSARPNFNSGRALFLSGWIFCRFFDFGPPPAPAPRPCGGAPCPLAAPIAALGRLWALPGLPGRGRIPPGGQISARSFEWGGYARFFDFPHSPPRAPLPGSAGRALAGSPVAACHSARWGSRPVLTPATRPAGGARPGAQTASRRVARPARQCRRSPGLSSPGQSRNYPLGPIF
jgi:hypothetical protein